MSPKLIALHLFFSLISWHAYAQIRNESKNIQSNAKENLCWRFSPSSDWFSKLRLKMKPLRTDLKTDGNEGRLREIRPNEKRRRKMKEGESLQLRIRGHKRPPGRIAPKTEYKVELFNPMSQDVETLFLIKSSNQSHCGLGSFTEDGLEIVRHAEGSSSLDNETKRCFLKAESFMRAKATKTFTFVSPECGCINVSVYYAYRKNKATFIMRPKRTDKTNLHRTLCVMSKYANSKTKQGALKGNNRGQRNKIRRPQKLHRRRKNRKHLIRASKNRNWTGNSTGDLHHQEKSEAVHEHITYDKGTIEDAELILHKIYNKEENELKALSENEGGSETDEDEGSGEEGSDEDEEGDESSESEESDESDENEEEDENEEDDENENSAKEENQSEEEEEEEKEEQEEKEMKDGEDSHEENEDDKNETKAKPKKLRRRRKNLRKINNMNRQRKPNGNYFKASRLCCKQGIKHKKFIIYNKLQNNKVSTERCDEAPLEMVSWAKQNLKVSEGFCNRRFAQCCQDWTLPSSETEIRFLPA